MSAEPFDIPNCRCDASTKAAILVIIPGKGSHWIPKSVVDDDSEVYKPGTAGRLVIALWFAEKYKLA